MRHVLSFITKKLSEKLVRSVNVMTGFMIRGSTVDLEERLLGTLKKRSKLRLLH